MIIESFEHNRPIPIANPDNTGRLLVADSHGIVNDLITVIAYYTVPSVTMDLVTLVNAPLAYSKSLWKNKACVECRGVVFDDDVVARLTTWYTYYRLFNQREYGTAALLSTDGKITDILRGATGIFNASTPTYRKRIGIITLSGITYYDIAPKKQKAKRKYRVSTGNRTISGVGLRKFEMAFGGDQMYLNECGEVWANWREKPVQWKHSEPLVDLGVGPMVLQRDGELFDVYSNYRSMGNKNVAFFRSRASVNSCYHVSYTVNTRHNVIISERGSFSIYDLWMNGSIYIPGAVGEDTGTTLRPPHHPLVIKQPYTTHRKPQDLIFLANDNKIYQWEPPNTYRALPLPPIKAFVSTSFGEFIIY